MQMTRLRIKYTVDTSTWSAILEKNLLYNRVIQGIYPNEKVSDI